MMKKPKKLSDSEWEIMQGVWDGKTPVTVRELHSRVYPNGEKAYTTVQTIMNILFEKGFLTREKIGLVNFYTPTLTLEEATSRETKTLVSKLFDGSFGAMANYLINSGELSQHDLDALKKLIAEKEAKQSEQ
ncbi:MAG: BlaI/MecI/CopY family transcriptional regulator [bacterium]